MKFRKTIAAFERREVATWALADALVTDFREAGIDPTPRDFHDAVEEIADHGYEVQQKYLADIYRVAIIFPKSVRKTGISVAVYAEILAPLHHLYEIAQRPNKMREYSARYFRFDQRPTKRGARAWAKKEGQKVRDAQWAAEQAETRKQAKKDIKLAEKNLDAAIKANDRKRAERMVGIINGFNRILGLDPIQLNWPKDETKPVEVTVDEGAVKADEKREDKANVALQKMQYGIARIGTGIAYTGNTWLEVRGNLEDLEDDSEFVRDLKADILDQLENELLAAEERLRAVREKITGKSTYSDDDFNAALTKWAAES